eukprot:365949-Chlamydomonas_euryale.AAC.18
MLPWGLEHFTSNANPTPTAVQNKCAPDTGSAGSGAQAMNEWAPAPHHARTDVKIATRLQSHVQIRWPQQEAMISADSSTRVASTPDIATDSNANAEAANRVMVQHAAPTSNIATETLGLLLYAHMHVLCCIHPPSGASRSWAGGRRLRSGRWHETRGVRLPCRRSRRHRPRRPCFQSCAATPAAQPEVLADHQT